MWVCAAKADYNNAKKNGQSESERILYMITCWRCSAKQQLYAYLIKLYKNEICAHILSANALHYCTETINRNILCNYRPYTIHTGCLRS